MPHQVLARLLGSFETPATEHVEPSVLYAHRFGVWSEFKTSFHSSVQRMTYEMVWKTGIPNNFGRPARLVIPPRRSPSTAVAPLRLVPHPRAAARRAS